LVSLQELQDKVLTPIGESLWFNHGCAYLFPVNDQHVIVDTEFSSGMPTEDDNVEVYRLGVYTDDDCQYCDTWIETTREDVLLTIIKSLYGGEYPESKG
jgi:hypothetical protein